MFKRGQYQLRKNNKNKTKTKKETDNNKGLFSTIFALLQVVGAQSVRTVCVITI